MTPQQYTVFLVLGATLALFAWGRWRYDVVALSAMFAVVATGIIPANEALLGFGHPAVITVAAVLMISRALRNSGIVDDIARHMMPYTKTTFGHIAVLTGVVTVCSAFMNNVGALALMLPVAMSTAAARKRSPAMLLMPLAFGSILGGLMTEIGTPPNIIIANYRDGLNGHHAFRMFDFAPVGATVALAGVLFVALIGWRLIPRERRKKPTAGQAFKISHYVSEVRVKEKSPLIGKKLGEVEAFTSGSVTPVGLSRPRSPAQPPSMNHELKAKDVLILNADPTALKEIVDEHGLETITAAAKSLDELQSENTCTLEVLVPQGSPLEGRTAKYLRRRSGGAIGLFAMARHGRPLRRRLRDRIFKPGDVLLLVGEEAALKESLQDLNLIPLMERDLSIGRKRRSLLALLVFAAAVTIGALGILPVAFAFGAAILGFVLLDILPVRDLYKEIDWPVIALLGGMIPVGKALEVSGCTQLISHGIVEVTGGMPVVVVLVLLMVVTMTLSDIVNNAATALVMAPIAVAIAHELGCQIDPFLMVVAVGASCAFLTPIGHQSNTLVMGPGGYHFGDYWRMGLPLEVMIVVIAIPMILWVWPL